MMVPKNTANERDWRLYQELAAQADLIISSGSLRFLVPDVLTAAGRKLLEGHPPPDPARG